MSISNNNTYDHVLDLYMHTHTFTLSKTNAGGWKWKWQEAEGRKCHVKEQKVSYKQRAKILSAMFTKKTSYPRN